jgi:folylpolyglutamate synthase/dihydropteroate synthase
LVRSTQAFEKALECAGKNDVVIVFGSFYTVTEVLEKYNFQQTLLENNGLLLASGGVV